MSVQLLVAFDTNFFLQRLFDGLQQGAVYAMLGLGLVIIYRSSGILNFAQGEMAMFSTYLVWALVGKDGGGGLNIWVALIVAMVISFAFAAAIQALVIRPLGDPHLNPLAVVIATIGAVTSMVSSLLVAAWPVTAAALVDRAITLYGEGALTPEEAAKVKFWTTEREWEVLDTCVQLHGGYGYITEYPIARAFLDARVHRIYGGTNEIMREIVGRQLAGRR